MSKKLGWLFLLVVSFFWFSSANANGTPYCTLNGATGSNAYTDCIKPISQQWLIQYNGGSKLTQTPEQAALVFMNQWTTVANPHFCDNGPCSSSFQASGAPNALISGTAFANTVDQWGNPTHASNVVNLIAICPINYQLYDDYLPDGVNRAHFCRPFNGVTDSLNQAESADASNTEGTCHTCNPVHLGDLNKTDDVVDFQNQSPYPIIWSRHFNGRRYGWIFNYERKITGVETFAGKGSQLTSAQVTLLRQDGQTIPMTGTKSGSTWTWVPNLGNTTKNATVLLTLQTDVDLNTWTVKTHTDETETYDAQGHLTSLQDTRNLPLTFTYDTQGRLSHIQDASNRILDISYPTLSTTQNVPVSNGQGGTIDVPMTSYSDYSGGIIENRPEVVTDGTLSVGYVFAINANDSVNTYKAIGLSQVIKPDGKVITYVANNYNQYTGIVDENGDRYTTYAYNGSGVSQTYHGNQQELIKISSNGVTLPNNQTINYSTTYPTFKMTSQGMGCPWCFGTQNKSMQYDSAGNPNSLTDFNNNTETRIYDQARGVPTSITEASGTPLSRTTTLTWDSRFLKPTQVVSPVQTPQGAGSLTSNFTYDNQGNLTSWSKTAQAGSYSKTISGSATYNTFGEPLTVTNARGKVTTYTYDTAGNLQTIQDALSHTTTFSEYDPEGNATVMTDPNGLRTELTFNELQHLTQLRTGCLTSGCHWETTTITYTPFEKVETLTLPNGRGLKYHYDTAHRVTQIDALGVGGTVLGTTNLTLIVGSEVSNVVFKDASGNIIQTKAFNYDVLSRLKETLDSNNKSFQQSFDGESNLSTTLDPLNHGRVMLYDALNRLTKVTEPDSTYESTGYGVGDEVISQTDEGNHSTTYTLDGFGNVVNKTSPDSGQTTYGYDNDFNLTSITDARGKTLTTTFDDLDRPLLTTSTSGESIQRVYDTCTNGIGHLCSVTDRTGTTSFEYDLYGRVTQKSMHLTTATGFITLTLGYAYNNQGQLTGITYPSSHVVTQSWTNGDISGLTFNGNTLLSSITYDAWHRLKGWNGATGRNVSFDYDLDGRLSQIQYGTSTVRAWTYDDAWRLGGVNQTNPTLSLSYGYDNRDRLTNSNNWGSYTYDNNSNRLSYLGTLGPMSYGIGTSNNQLVSLNSSVVTNDAAGNILSIPLGSSFTFDDWGRMRTSTNGSVTTTYGVNALGERISKTQGATQVFYVYAGVGQLLGIYDQTGQPLEEFIYLGSRPVEDVRGSNVYQIETDNIQTPVRVLDSSNTTVWSWEDREPFGASTPTEGSVGSLPFVFNLRFPGQYFDAESGLVQNGYRDYAPSLGRYIEVDPMGLAAGMNPYGYVGGSPLGSVDPNGLKTTVVDFRGLSPAAQKIALIKSYLVTPKVPSDYKKARDYLVNNSPTAKAYIKSLEDSSTEYRIYLFDRGGDFSDEKVIGENAIHWIPSLGYTALCEKGFETYYNPAILLLHELGHLSTPWPNSRAPMDFTYGDLEERRVITELEAQVYKELTGNGMIRATHGDYQGIDMGWSVTSDVNSWYPK